MVSWSEYEHRTANFWIGKRVRLLESIATGVMTYPAGTIATITHKFKGFELLGDPCKCCKVRLRMKKVEPNRVELVDG